VSQTDFQSMVTGEIVSIARKNKSAICDRPWTAGLMMSGNHLPDFADAAGSVARRMVVFLLETLVLDRQTDLKHTIKQQELTTILLRCVGKYRFACSRYKGQDFWKFAPLGLKEINAQISEQTNHFLNFLQNGDDYYSIMLSPDAEVPMEELNKAYRNHMRITHQIDKATIGMCGFALKKLGFIKFDKKTCKSCGKPAKAAVGAEAACCPNYDNAKRSTRIFIKGMIIKKLKEAF
jgi:hypothetical protein